MGYLKQTNYIRENPSSIRGNLLLNFKRDLDKIAEVGWQEEKTKNYVIKKLGRDYVWSKKTALIYKLGKGKPVIFRAELDALPTKNGPRHVCGHSSHLAALMGAYLYFKNRLPENFCVYFVFQPAEECFPSGADFISKNFVALSKCKAAFAFHVAPDGKAGRLLDTVLASGDYFEIKIEGRSVHIKDKNTGGIRDALLAASVLAQEINSKRNPGWIINIGTLVSGDAPNKIAGGAALSGDIRALTEEGRRAARDYLYNVCRKIQKSSRSKVKLLYCQGYPVLKNDPETLRKMKKIFNIKIGAKSFGTEDFSFYPVPKVFLHVGTGDNIKLHADNFDVSAGALRKIFSYWVRLGENLDKVVG